MIIVNIAENPWVGIDLIGNSVVDTYLAGGRKTDEKFISNNKEAYMNEMSRDEIKKIVDKKLKNVVSLINLSPIAKNRNEGINWICKQKQGEKHIFIEECFLETQRFVRGVSGRNQKAGA